MSLGCLPPGLQQDDALRRRFSREACSAAALESRAWDLALRCLYTGDPDRCLEWLEEACQGKDGNVPYIGFPTWDAVRSNPRFQDIWRRVGLPG